MKVMSEVKVNNNNNIIILIIIIFNISITNLQVVKT